MGSKRRYVAVDVGAESGRVIAGAVADDRIELDVVHRFPTGGIRMLDSLCWDFPGFLREIRGGLRAYAAAYGREPESIGIDTWSDAYGLLDKSGRLLANPLHYRDGVTAGAGRELYRKIDPERIYALTGIHMMGHKLIYQMYGSLLRGDPLFDVADKMLMGAELLYHFLSGVTLGEYSDVSTTQLYNLEKDDWAWEVIDAAGFPRRLFPEVVKPGAPAGTLLPAEADDCNLGRVPLTFVATHDTGSAVAGIPAADDGDWLFISSGTWSLAGVELARPILTPEAMRMAFTNEGGAEGSVRFLKNIAGLWILQEMRREWVREGMDLGYDELTALAATAKPFPCVIDVADPRFVAPGDMARKIVDVCRESGQAAPTERGEFVRAALEGLALAYREFVRDAAAITGRRRRVVHVVGGGSRNRLLNQLTADATGLVVKAGPAEATAYGNIIVQAKAAGQLGSVWDGRGLLAKSGEMVCFEPASGDDSAWREAEALIAAMREKRGLSGT